MRPDGAGDQNDGCESKAGFGGGNSEPIPARLAAKDVLQISDEADEKRSEGGPSTRDVKIENALNEAHAAFCWRNKERRVRGSGHQQDNHNSGNHVLHHAALPTPEVILRN